MVQEGLSFILVLGAGALLLKPGDFPLFARVSGRLVGLAVRSIRTTKEAAEKAITHTANTAHQQNPDMIVMRENLKQSLDKFKDLTNTVRRDMADVPLNPTSLFAKGLRTWEAQARKPSRDENDQNGHGTGAEDDQLTSSQLVSKSRAEPSRHVEYSQPLRVKSSIASRDQSVSGGDLLSRAIEEHALALQKKRLFSQTVDTDAKKSRKLAEE